jgi:NADH-quinone oxidoreductase subunit J
MIQFFFAYFAIAVLILSLVVITRRNPIHAVLAMLIMFFHIAGLYILLNAEFLAAVQVIVYAGAILVLFLFAIMVLNLKEELTIQTYVGSWSVAVAAAGGLFLMVVFGLTGVKVARLGPHSIDYIQHTTHSKALGKEMFVNYLLPFEVVSVILLVAIIGAIVLAKKKMKE